MKFQYCSDLHLEFSENRKWLAQHPIIPSADILLLAGDILLLSQLDSHSNFLDFVADSFEKVYWIPGNHEYYGYDIAHKPASFNEKIRSNVHLINNQHIRHENVNLIFTTLWSHISQMNEGLIKRSMSDFDVIYHNGRRLMPAKFTELHQECLSFLETTFKVTAGQPSVVVTHHVPTLLNYPKQYINSPINEGFAVELFDVIEQSKADYWIYGHHHANGPSFQIGQTSLVTNQLGYVMHNEHSLFCNKAIVSVSV